VAGLGDSLSAGFSGNDCRADCVRCRHEFAERADTKKALENDVFSSAEKPWKTNEKPAENR